MIARGAGAAASAAAPRSLPQTARGRGRTSRGEQTRRRLLDAAEVVFADHGYHDASIVKITEAAGVGQGTFYLYFRSKLEIFEELVDDLNRRVRHAMAEAVAGLTHRRDIERAGLLGFLRFTAEHPALYSIVRQSDLVAPHATRRHYELIAEPYAEGLRRAMDDGTVVPGDPEVLAYALMAVGEMIGRRYVLWTDDRRAPQGVVDEALAFINRGLGIAEPA